MNEALEFAKDYWWLIFPVGAVVGGWATSLGKYNERRRRDKIELARIKAGATQQQRRAVEADKKQVKATWARHDELNERWFAYELDLATLIDYPMLIDMREPLTQAFHKAKVRADELRPDTAAALDPDDFDDYREAVRDYAAALDGAEREARRRKQGDFSPIEREALARARKLIGVADDSGATPAERQAAYRRARRELDGLIDIPPRAATQLEGRIAAALEPGRG